MAKRKANFLQRLMAREFHRHPFAVPVVTLIFLSFGTMFASVILGGQTIGANDSHVVQLSLDGKRQIVPTRAIDVNDFLVRAKVNLNDGDIVEPSRDTPIDNDNFRINVYRARPVTIFDGDKRVQALSAATTPRSVAAQVGIQVYPEDDLKQEVSSNVLKDQVIGEKIVIDRATPANLNLYGTQATIRTRSKTVGDLLKEKNIKLGSGDSVQPDAKTPLTPNLSVFVTRTGTQIVTSEVAIPVDTQTVEDPSLSFGTTAIRQQGSAGKKLVTYQLDLQNGKETGRHIIQEVITVPPVTQIIARGKAIYISPDHSSLMAAAGISSGDYPYVDYIVSHESGWCPTKLQGNPGACPGYAPAYIPNGYGYGMCQSTPGSKMASAGADWQTNPVTQLRWCSGYASRYGGWAGSYQHWVAYHNW
ncbi:MAG TPA: G5 domain-containing protein [Patescibacteria group bacterium]|nr:G5 domain-containing protein [Patescibacteria group bacterium]